MDLNKIRKLVAIVAAAITCTIASSAYAAVLATNDFEAARVDFVADIGGEDLSIITNYVSYPSGSAVFPYSGTETTGFGTKYLSVDSGEATLLKDITRRTDTTYLDAFVQFEPMTSDFTYTNDAKIVVYLDAATSNLCVISGTSADDTTPVTNVLDTARVEPSTWGRLTIKAIGGNAFTFQIYVNGTRYSAGVKDTFYSLTSGNSITHFGVKGTGALDNFVARTSDPNGNAASIGDETFDSLESAIAEANADTVVTLTTNHVGKLYLADAATYKIDNSGGHTFGGIAGVNGYKVTASDPVEGVTTYTATDAFASQPSPVVLWDGNSENYDFNTLTRTVGDNTYTLNLNDQNTVGGSGAYIQTGPNNAQKGVTITAVNANPAITNAFGTSGAVTVIMKCRNMPATAGSNRAIIGLLDNTKYNESDNRLKIGLCNNIEQGGARFIWEGAYYWNNAPSLANAFSTNLQVIALTYSYTAGTKAFLDGATILESSALKSSSFTTPCGISLCGADVDTGRKFYAMTNMQIEAIAVFTSTLSSDEVAAYAFPSSRIAEDIAVSEINAIFDSESEICLNVLDGATITGDTTFNASTVRFHCNGSFSIAAPANNEATFDFSDVTGQPAVIYSGALPSVSGTKFTSTSIPEFVTDAAQWTGTIWIKNVAVSNFAPSNFGNANSTVRLSGVSGHFAQGSVSCAPAIELVNDSYQYGFNVNNGYSRSTGTPNNFVVINKLKGNGALWTGNAADTVLMQVLDWSEFSGAIQLVNKIVVFGSYLPPVSEFNTAGGIYIGANETVAVPSGKEWRADGKVHVYGTFKTTGLGQLKSAVANSNPATIVHAYDSGTFVLTTNSNTDDLDVDYSKIEGTGTLRYEGTGYRTISRSNFPTTMTVENNLSNNGLIHRVPNAELSIGSLAGNGRIRSDWGGSESIGDRDLRILQSKDTTYDGLFDTALDRINNVIVAPGASSAGTLTITGEQRANNNLVIESRAKVNLTGTWVGAATVAGTLGGTGTLTGNLTLSDGATLKVNDASDPIAVSGSLEATGAITIALPEGATSSMSIRTSSTPNIAGATFTVTVGGKPSSRLKVVALGNELKIVPLKPMVILF